MMSYASDDGRLSRECSGCDGQEDAGEFVGEFEVHFCGMKVKLVNELAGLASCLSC
jgi:hypothetical protein